MRIRSPCATRGSRCSSHRNCASSSLQRRRARAGDFDVRGAVDEYEACYRRLCPSAADAPADAPKPARRTTPGIEIRPATEDDRPAILALLTKSLGWHDDPRYQALFEWKHDQNPFGPSPMWVACDGDRVVALRVFMRWQFRRGDETLRAVRAVDTATDPDYQGKGLFTALTMHGLDALCEPTASTSCSTPPTHRASPATSRWVGRWWARCRRRSGSAGPRSLATTAKARVPADLWSLPLDVGVPFTDWLQTAPTTDAANRIASGPREIVTDRSAAFLAWRYGTPLLGYRAVPSDGGALVIAWTAAGRCARAGARRRSSDSTETMSTGVQRQRSPSLRLRPRAAAGEAEPAPAASCPCLAEAQS